MGAIRTNKMPRVWQSDAATKKPRQEICAPLKWLCFTVNFMIFLIGVTGLALGVYLCIKDPRPIAEWEDVALNPAILITLLGLAIGGVSLCGLFGALRDNVFLLRAFALFLFCAYVVLVVATFALFTLFYADLTGLSSVASGGSATAVESRGSLAEVTGISAHSILLYALRKYHMNRNVADFVDYVQDQLECCGASASTRGFRDWQLNEQFACNRSNPYPERCGVPFSCCRKTIVGASNGADVGRDAGADSLLPAMRSLQCWQNVQTKRDVDLDTDIYTRGCLQPLRTLFERHAIHLGAGVAAVILPVCIGVCLTQCLARQIDYQRYLLDREARRHQRQKRRELRYAEQQYTKRKQQQDSNKQHINNNNNKDVMVRMEAGLQKNFVGGATLPKIPMAAPKFPPPPTPRDEPEAAELAAAITASRRQWREDEERRRRRRRAVSQSPTRQHATVTVAGLPLPPPSQMLGAAANKRQKEIGARDASRRASTILNDSSGTTSRPAMAPTAPPLPSYASQQYLLKQSDFS